VGTIKLGSNGLVPSAAIVSLFMARSVSWDLTQRTRFNTIAATDLPVIPSTPVVASLMAPRVIGPAPFVTTIDALGSSATGVTNPLRDLSHSMAFGEGSIGSWAIDGVPITSKNTHVGGPLAVHAWVTPGTYQVTNTVSHATLGSSVAPPLTITVQDPAIVWPTTNTICVSPTANYAGAPAGATLQTTMPTSAQYSGKRVLLHKGETFAAIEVADNSVDWFIGSYGTGARPIITPSGGTCLRINWGCQRGIFTGLNMAAGNVIQTAHGKQLTSHDNLYRMLLWADAFGFWFDNQPANVPYNQQQLYASHDVGVGQSGASTNVSTAIASYLGYVGCDYNSNFATQHTVRLYGWHKLAITSCAFRAVEGEFVHSLKAHANTIVDGIERFYTDATATSGRAWSSQYGVISRCCFGDALSKSDWIVAVAPQNNTYDERVRDVIYENNVHRGNVSFVDRELTQAAHNLITRGNVGVGGVPFRYGIAGEGGLPSGFMEHWNL